MPVVINRRSFVERLGLGAGAALLGPTIASVEREARGAAPTRKRFLVMVQGNGMDYNMTAPPGHTPADLKGRGVSDKMLYTADITKMAKGWAALEPFRNRMLYVDGLSSFVGENDHHLCASALSCLPAVGFQSQLSLATGPTFDQYVAKAGLGAGMVFPSILLGVSYGPGGDKPVMGNAEKDTTRMFAYGAGKPAPHYAWATAAYKAIFGSMVPAAAGGAPLYNRRKRLLDFLKDDAQRLQSALASPERQKIDQLLGSVDTLDLQMAAAAKQASADLANAKLDPAAFKNGEPGGRMARATLQGQIAAASLMANLTNVVGYTANGGNVWGTWGDMGFKKNTHDHGHGDNEGMAIHPLDQVHNFYAGILASMMKQLDSVREGDGTMLDNTIIVWLSDAAEAHHPNMWRWPTIVLANPRGPIKTGGRFLRYPLVINTSGNLPIVKRPTAESIAKLKYPGCRCLADLFCTISHALGVPTDKFGSGGTENVQGPLPELM